MKSILAAVLLVAPLLCAQSTSKVRYGQLTDAQPLTCASVPIQFSVKKDNTQHALPQAAPNKAQIVFIHDSGGAPGIGYPTTKLAIDGAWVGANHNDNWFAVSVEPGEHHLCVTLQSSLVGDRVEFAHLTAQAGSVYYFRTRLLMSRQMELLELEPVDSDEGDYLLRIFSMSVSKPRK